MLEEHRHWGAAGLAARPDPDRPTGHSPRAGQGGQGRAELGPVPGSGHDLGPPSLEQSKGVLGPLPREGRRHHTGEPGLVHAVDHPVGLVDDLSTRRHARWVRWPQQGPSLPRGGGLGGASYQEAEVLEAEPRGLVDVVHQAAGSGHHDVSQAAEAVHPAERRALSQAPRAPSRPCPPAPAPPGPCPAAPTSPGRGSPAPWPATSAR